MSEKPALPRVATDMTRAFVFAWVVSLAFYFLEYAVRSSPAVMIPQLAIGMALLALMAGGCASAPAKYYSLVGGSGVPAAGTTADCCRIVFASVKVPPAVRPPGTRRPPQR
jgi:hypothetical protein